MSQEAASDGRRYHHGNLRAALVEAGLELTRQGGPGALGLREVTRRVGVSPNAAYRHFDGRAALEDAVAVRIRALMAERMLIPSATGAEPRVGAPDEPVVEDGADPAAARADDPAGPHATDPTALGDADRARARLRAVGLGYIDFAVSEPGWFAVAFFPPGDARAAGAVSAEGPATAEGPAPAAAAAPPERREPTAAHPYLLLTKALDDMVAAGVLAQAAREGAQWPCWSAVHGFAELAIHGPLRDLPAGRVLQIAERTVDAIIAGICD